MNPISSLTRDAQIINPAPNILKFETPYQPHEDSKTGMSQLAFNSHEFTDSKNVNFDSIWSSDVEDAFQEALSMIPKNGLKKNKICRMALGRNQFISMYIEAITGEKRTPKQISSHIQTILRSNKNKRLTQLIKHGSPNNTDIQSKFHQIFSVIIEAKGKKPESKFLMRPKQVKSSYVKSILFSQPNRLETLLPSIVVCSEQIKKFPNLLVNLHSIRELMFHELTDTKVSDLPSIPIPLIYSHSKIYLPNVENYDLNDDINCGNEIELVFHELKNLQLGVLTMAYCKNQKISEDFVLIQSDRKQYNLDFTKKFWTSRITTKVEEYQKNMNVPNWFNEVEAITLEHYIVSVSNNGMANICIDYIQSIVISDFEYCTDAESCETNLMSCIGYDFDINILYPLPERIPKEVDQQLQNPTNYVDHIGNGISTTISSHRDNVECDNGGGIQTMSQQYPNCWGGSGVYTQYQTKSESGGVYQNSNDTMYENYNGYEYYDATTTIGTPQPLLSRSSGSATLISDNPNNQPPIPVSDLIPTNSEMYKPIEMVRSYNPTMNIYEDENNCY